MNPMEPQAGLELAVGGAWYVFWGGNFTWFANPFLFCSWIFAFKRNWKPACTFATLSLLMALYLFLWDSHVLSIGKIELLQGAWLWFISISVQLILTNIVMINVLKISTKSQSSEQSNPK